MRSNVFAVSGSRQRLRFWWPPLALFTLTSAALAQSTDTNVVTASEDAFGVSIGVEELGVYSPSDVRGFDPLAAGNTRIEGLYVDIQGPVVPYGPMPSRIVDNTRIRVGPAAAGFVFPSPTGIVDFSLRSPLGEAVFSPTIYVGPYGTRGIDLDAHLPLAGGQCGIGAGITRRRDEFVPELTQLMTDVGFLAACRIASHSEVSVFYGRTVETQQRIFPTVYLTAAATPRPTEPRNTAPAWARGTTLLMDFGGVIKHEASEHWTLRAGLFRSVYDQPNSGSDLLLDPDAAGIAQHAYVSYPDQVISSTSGEVRATHLTTVESRQHELIFTVRARNVNASYGGYDLVDLGDVQLGARSLVSQPTFRYSPLTRDHIHQWTLGAAYALHWKDVAELAGGLQQARYERLITEPAVSLGINRENPVLYYLSAGVPITSHASIYASLTRGLEDSGLAPPSATNRGEPLPASRTSQEEVGIRYTSDATTVIAGLFDVRKPYYNDGSDGAYVLLGKEIHRGIELSATTQLLSALTVVIGAVILAPQVSLAAGVEGVGSVPIGQPRRTLQLAADYQFTKCPRCSLDITATHTSRVPVRLDDGAYNPARTLVNLGARYKFPIMGHPTTLRVQVENVTNQRIWTVIDSSGGLIPYPPQHSVLAHLSADF